jgi:hypothetical protein
MGSSPKYPFWAWNLRNERTQRLGDLEPLDQYAGYLALRRVIVCRLHAERAEYNDQKRE